jgi:hypothetical protein
MEIEMSITDATRAVDQKDAAQQTMREILALIEDTSNYVAKATRNMTTASPERRKLREEMERAFLDFIRATGSSESARAYTVQPETIVSLMLSQSMTADPPTPSALLVGGRDITSVQQSDAAAAVA